MQRKWQVLLVVCTGVFVASLDLFIVNIAFSDIAADFEGTSTASLSWILSAYAIVQAALLVPAGRWADAVGRKRVFLQGLALFVLASAACAAAPSVGVLIAARVLQGAGAALMLPTSLGLLLPEFTGKDRTAAVGAWAAAAGVAAATGPPLGGLLVEASWRWVFLVNLPVGLVALVAGARILHEVRDPHPTRPDVLGAAGTAVGVGSLVVAITQGPDWGWGDVRVLGGLVLAVVSVALVARRSTHHPAPIVEPELLRVRAFAVACAGSLLFFAAFSAMLLGGVLLLTGPWDRSVLTAGLMLAPGPLTAALCSVPGARLGGRLGHRRVGAAGGALFALGGLSWLVLLGDDTAWATTFLPGMILTGAGVGLVNPTLTASAAAALPPDRFATGSAVLTMGRQVGSALGVAILVAVLGTPDGVGDFDGAWTVVALGGAAAGLALAALGPVGRQASDPAVAPAAMVAA